jgi:hypothetical protein
MKKINIIILIIVGLLIIGGAFWYFGQSRDDSTKQESDDEKVEIADEEQEIQIDVIDLSAVGGFDASGTADRIFENGVFTHTVEADLSDPADGKFYEGWLVKSSPSLQFFSTGAMMKEDGKWVLKYTANEDKSEYNEVVITLETSANGLDGNPETHVLEGKF